MISFYSEQLKLLEEQLGSIKVRTLLLATITM